jgi:tetratricopeptide (TPR) repeat protein
MLDRLDDARQSLRLGLWFAWKRGDERARANLLQRRAYVELDMLRLDRALGFAESAFAAYHFLGDEEGMGQTLVDRGLVLVYLKRTDDAIKSYSQALDHLAPDSHLNRFWALHSLGFLHGLRKREVGVARGYIARARRQLPHLRVQKQSRAKLLWLEASLDRLDRRPASASDKLALVVELLAEIRPPEAVIAGLELAEAQFMVGGPRLAYSAVMGLLRFVEKLEETPASQAAVESLLKVHQRTLTLEKIRQTRGTLIKIQDAPERPGRNRWLGSGGG